MNLRRTVVDAVDRPGGRAALAALSTRLARRGTELDVQVLYDRAWVHRIGSTYVPVSDRFEYRRDWDSALATMLDPIAENWFFAYRPREGDTIVDVGAGDGLDSLVFSRAVGAGGRVLAVEAHPTTFVLLEQTCRLNGLANVTPLQYAAMDRPGTVTLAEEGSHRDFYSIFANGNGNGSVARKQVPGATLDHLCRDLERVDFLKMNIEGAERYALQGAGDVLARTSHVCVACHDFVSERDAELATKAFVVEFLREYGFEVVLREDHALPWARDHVHAVRRPTSPDRR
jgi:FkbM family methyltransferase